MRREYLAGVSAFAAVATHKSFTGAAAQLGLSPSAVSHAVRELESRLGLRLLNRSTRSVALTEAGETYLARVAPALGAPPTVRGKDCVHPELVRHQQS